MIKRTLGKVIQKQLHNFPVISITGPRQSGKTTLIKKLFPKAIYVNLEEPDIRLFAINDPRGFLDTYTDNDRKMLIIDEAQHVPKLFSYIQTRVDAKKRMGQFILTGSQNFLLNEKISQSLAGRIYKAKLLPLDLEELYETKYKFPDINTQLFKGFYPRLYESKINPQEWYPSYIETYIERDVRSIKQITNLNTFHTFIRLCAARTGQVMNLSSLASDIGISHVTIRSWLSILEESYIIFFLEPFYKNFNKRIIKAPKLHFFDSGLVCQLLGIKNSQELSSHYLRGALFESFVTSNIIKSHYHRGIIPNLYYWRDKTGHEIDCLVKSNNKFIPIEIKAGKTIHDDDFKNINYWNKLSDNKIKSAYIIYSGDEKQKRSQGNVISWKLKQKSSDFPI